MKRKNDSVRSAENNAAPAANKPRRRNHYFSQPQQLQKQENGFPEQPQSSPDNQNIPPQIVLVDDDFDYDEESREKKSSAPMIVAVVMAVIVVLGAAGFLSYLFLFSDKGGSDNSSSSVHKSDETVPETEEVPSSQPITANVVEKQVTMPDISGLTESEAYKKLNNAGVKYKVKREYSSDVALNMVIAQAPEAGTKFSRSENLPDLWLALLFTAMKTGCSVKKWTGRRHSGEYLWKFSFMRQKPAFHFSWQTRRGIG